MPTYGYRCPACKGYGEITTTIEDRADVIECNKHDCPGADRPSAMRRVFHPPMVVRGDLDFSTHYNHALGDVVSSRADFRSELARRSDEASERLGQSVDYQPVDYRDHAPPGAAEQRRERELTLGMTEPKVILT